MAAPRPTLGHYRGGSLNHPTLIICVLHIRPEDHWEPLNKVRSLSPAERLVVFEPGTFRFWSQHLNPLGHYHLQLSPIYLWGLTTNSPRVLGTQLILIWLRQNEKPNRTTDWYFWDAMKTALNLKESLFLNVGEN